MQLPHIILHSEKRPSLLYTVYKQSKMFWMDDLVILVQTSMVGKGFITDGEDIVCPECAKKKLMADTVEQ